jgi:hypothetical protein
MARAIRYNVTTTGAGTWLSLDNFQSPFSVGVSVDVNSPATCTYTVQYTDNDVNDSSLTVVVWSDPALTSQTASAQTHLQRPTRFARINVAALSLSTGTVALNLIQGMSSR